MEVCSIYNRAFIDKDIVEFKKLVVSLNLPMIYQEAKLNNKDFYKELDIYLQMIRELLLKRYEYVGKAKANSNPLMWCQGGAYKGNLNPDDSISHILESWTASFGITALNELTWLKLGKPISEDNSFALEVMKYINDKVNEFKKEDGKLYAIYGTPRFWAFDIAIYHQNLVNSESWCV